MSDITRASILGGPGIVTWRSSTFHHTGPVTLTPNVTLFDVATERSGVVDRRVDDITHTARLTPAGLWSETLYGLLYPHLNPVIGSNLFGATAYPLVVTGVTHSTGNVLTLVDAAITKMPSLTFSAGKTLFGEAEWTGLSADGVAWSNATANMSVGNASPAGTDVEQDDIITQPYDAAWGSLTDIETESGWTVDFEMSISPRKTDRGGTRNFIVNSVGARAKCVPVNLTSAEILAAMPIQGSGMARGASVRTRANDLVISGVGVSCTIYNAALVTAGHVFGAKELRNGEIGFVAHRDYDTGAYGALCDLGVNL